MHECIVTRLTNIQPIKGADRIVQATVNDGTVDIGTVVTSIEHTEGELGLFFDSDLQLSEEYTTANDLVARYDETGKKINNGYLSEKRRITAQKFKGVKSDGLWMPLSSINYIAEKHYGGNLVSYEVLSLGKSFTHLGVAEICRKYFNEKTLKEQKENRTSKKETYVLNFPQHVDTEQLIHHIRDIPVGSVLTITEKLHGTSHRVAHVPVKVHLPWYKRWINQAMKFITSWPDSDEVFKEWEYKIVHGSRRVILDDNKPGFYGSNQFRYDAIGAINLPQDMVVYGEIVGYVNETTPIMNRHDTKGFKDIRSQYGDVITYTYDIPEGHNHFFVYRITQNGKDLPYDETFKDIAFELGCFSTPWQLDQFVYDGDQEKLLNRVKELAEGTQGFVDSKYTKNHLSEGVVVRVDYNGVTNWYKYKSFGFRLLEGIVKENPDTVDIEEVS